MSSKARAEQSRALAAAARYTRARVRSSQELRSYLARYRVAPAVQRYVLQVCKRGGAIDDRISARLWAEHWARRGYASIAIAQKLAGKGFPDEIIANTIAQSVPPSGDEDRARQVLASAAPHRSGDRRAKARLARTLASRGFDSDLIERALHDSHGVSDSDAEQ